MPSQGKMCLGGPRGWVTFQEGKRGDHEALELVLITGNPGLGAQERSLQTEGLPQQASDSP